MGLNNKQRRAAKARQRRRDHARRAHHERQPFDFAPHVAEFALGQHIRHRVRGGTSAIALEQFLACAAGDQQAAVDDELVSVLPRLFEIGWTPQDLYESARRKHAERVVAHLMHVVAECTARQPAGAVHPGWREQLAALHSAPGHAATAAAWARAAALPWPDAAPLLVDLLVTLFSLPSLTRVLPPPGTTFAAPEAGTIDEKVLRRVRALLAKAESTDFADEADALTGKAQQLMTQYTIDRTLAEASAPVTDRPAARRLWLDNPYVAAKSLLVDAVAEANHCRGVLSERWGFVTLVGHRRDLHVVELLSTSLLVQATRAMTLAGPQRSRAGGSRTRSYRQSFLVAYAARIAERLRDAAASTEAAADAAHSGALLPALASRQKLVDDEVGELFPGLVQRDVSVSNGAGWVAGRAAADLALFDIRGPLEPSSRTG